MRLRIIGKQWAGPRCEAQHGGHVTHQVSFLITLIIRNDTFCV